MRKLQNMPIRYKQMLIIMLTSGVALVLMCATFVFYRSITFRRELVVRETALAEVVGNNIVAAMDFNDRKSATETLAILQSEPNIIAACIFDRSGQPFAVYQREGFTQMFSFPKTPSVGHKFTSGQLHLFVPIKQKGILAGTVFVVSSMEVLSRELTRFGGIAALIFLGSLAIALALSSGLQRVVSNPILRLVQVMRTVAQEKNYSLRAIKRGHDETGELIEGFNEMLAQIQERDAALQSARNLLEHRVNERTQELQRENVERKRAEERLLVINALSELLLPPAPVEQKFKLITDTVVRVLGADFARVWNIKRGDRCEAGCIHAEVKEGPHVCRFREQCLRLMASSGRYTHLDGKGHCRVPFGCYKIGRIAAGDEIKFLTNEVTTDPRVHNHAWAKELGLVSFAGYRLTNTDGIALGVLALFSQHPISPEDDALLEGIAHITSRVIRTSLAEEALQESQALYRSLVEQLPAGVFCKDKEGRYTFVNSWFCRLKGMRLEQFLGKTPQEFAEYEVKELGARHLVVDKFATQGASHHKQIMQTGKRIEVEEEYVGADGNVQHLHVIKTPVFGAGGTVVGTQGIMFDITERRRMETALQESQALYHSLVEQLPSGVFRKEPEGRYVFVNSYFCKLLGFPKDQILGRTASEVMSSSPAKQKSRYAAELGMRGEEHHRLIMKTGRSVEVDDEYWGADHKPRYYHTVKTPVFGLAGQIIGTQGILFDVTERMRAEEALRESQILYHALVEQMPAGVFRKDAEGRYVFVNSWFCKLKGFKAEQFLGKTPHEIAVSQLEQEGVNRDEVIRLAAQGMDNHELIMETGRQIELEEHSLDADGREQHLHVVKSPIFGLGGTVVGTQGVIFDVTRHKQLEVELAHERDLFKALLDNFPDSIYFKDLQSRFVRVSKSKAEKAFAFSLRRYRDSHPDDGANNLPKHLTSLEEFTKTLAGKSDFDFLPEEFARSLYEEEQEIIRTGKPVIGKLDHSILFDGRSAWYLSTKMPWRDENGKIVGTFGTTKDITAIKQAEVDLAYERDLLETLMGNLPDTIYFKDLQSRFVRVSRSKLEKSFALCLTQYRASRPADDKEPLPPHLTSLERFAEYLTGKSDFDFFEEEEARRVFEQEQEIIRTGSPQVGQLEHIVRKDGSSAWFLSTKMPWRDKIGNIIGVFGTSKDVSEIKEAQAKIEYERHLLRLLLDSSPDDIYFKDRESRFIYASNALAQRFKARNATELEGKTDFDFFSEEHARQAFEDEQKIIRTGQPVIGKPEKETWPDGQVTWVLTSKLPLRDPQGKIIGTFGISKDITSIKEAEAKLEQVHRQLMEASRRAGMAEIASNVLHNVGNVLNSVNVSVSVLTQKVKQSKVANLEKAGALLREHSADLLRFLTTDPKGRQLPDYLVTLAQHLAKEQHAFLSEVEGLAKNVEHIKEIVAMQQTYAKVAGVAETVSAIDLVEDAVRMNIGAFSRHSVQLVREYSEVPPMTTEKHKVLQILVNLLHNAKYALDEGQLTKKLLRLRVEKGGPDSICISVIDNGVGIPPENLIKIFAHGFTTRQHGHGFGLHSSALAAKDLGGTLTAHSKGLGKGARFTLELPIEKGKKNQHNT